MQGHNKKIVAIIIPAYNEAQGIQKCIDAVVNEIKKTNYPIKLILVNDGSSDNTEKIIKSNIPTNKTLLSLVTYKKNKGYGMALQEGIKEAIKQGCGYAIFMDSDLTNDPKYIKTFISFIDKNCDIVKASRYIKGGGMKNVPIKRKIVSVISSIIGRYLFNMGIKDVTNGFRMVRLELLKDIHFKENSFPIIVEELYYLKKSHATACEFPYVLTSRLDSKTHFRYNRKTLWGYLRYALKASLVR